ncbi:P-loop containing nucleoside triphosphate hydrolase protein [Metschnikowia bicuspidata]|uniref:DNA 3'-5' helicase n=1 Tax=Metschnikowia bicuspidata TaxID=27322 RepID=A0A4P9ZGQ1_9ASCO|nr:P-loop containing nucleoside triphosphate hydrolase protein [Metschnikowia bicuspidata]
MCSDALSTGPNVRALSPQPTSMEADPGADAEFTEKDLVATELRPASVDPTAATNATETHISVTESQEAVIKHPHRVSEILCVRAGPGSGKTFTLVARIAELTQRGIHPNEILVLSMANRSIDALRKSLCRLLDTEKEQLVVFSTFHSFCGSLLDTHRSTDAKRPRVASAKTMRMFAEFFLKKLVCLRGTSIGTAVGVRTMADFLPQLISGRISVRDVAEKHKINPEYLLHVVRHLRLCGIAVYDDIISDAVRLLNNSADAYHNAPDSQTAHACLLPDVARYKVVIVDEFQDIYPLLLEAIRAIVNYPTLGSADRSKHLTVAGDPFQCIYEFLGSSATYGDTLREEFPHLEIVHRTLDESFRCTHNILNAAAHVANERGLHLASLRPVGHGCTPTLYSATDSDTEAKWVTDEIVRLICLLGGAIQPRDIAVLGFTNRQMEQFHHMFRERTGLMNHRIRSDSEWPNSVLSVFGALAVVASGLSHASFDLAALLVSLDKAKGARQRITSLFVESLDDAEFAERPDFFERYLRHQLANTGSGTAASKHKLDPRQREWLRAVEELLDVVAAERSAVQEMHNEHWLRYGPSELAQFFRKAAILSLVRKHLNQASFSSSAVAEELLQSLNNTIHLLYHRYADLDETRAPTFLEFFAANYDSEVPAAGANSVELSTIHSAKGLEYLVVFVLGAHQRGPSVILPWNAVLAPRRPADDSAFGNKQSRLLYVAMTRARSLLYVGITRDLASTRLAPVFSTALPHLNLDELRAYDASSVARRAWKVQGKDSTGTPWSGVNVRPASVLPFFCADVGRQMPGPSKFAQGFKTYKFYRLQQRYCTLLSRYVFRPTAVQKGLHRAVCRFSKVLVGALLYKF